MARPKVLLQGDIILYRNYGWLGNLISWGEWNGTPGEALEYSHIGLVLDDVSSVEMNPPASRRFPLTEVPWDRVDVYRVAVNGANPFGLAAVKSAFYAAALQHLGEGYDYGLVAKAAGLSLLARIGLGGVSRWFLTRNNPAPDKGMADCSTWVETVLLAGMRTFDPSFDFFPLLGIGEARPSDWPRSPFVNLVGDE